MRALAIVHQDDAGPGVFAEAARRGGVELAEWHPAREAVPVADYAAIISFGAAANAFQEERFPWLRTEKQLLSRALAEEVPVLGVCLGAQMLAEAAGGMVRRASEPEIGWRQVVLEPGAEDDPVMGALPHSFTSFQWHSYEAVPPEDAVALARSSVCLQAFRLARGRAWGIQFHAEVSAENLEHWTRDYRSDEDAVAMGLNPDALSRESAPLIDGWNELGRGLCERFLEAAFAPATPA
jgi:GMP synthase (glutamine-hydrolysing)